MKKLLAILLALALVFSFAACGKKEPTDSSLSTNDTNVTTQTEFTAPENYATVLLVTINPQFKLYLDASNKVLAVEPVNDDAKAVAKDNTFTGELDTVIEKIVTAANDGGFVKENATVNFEVTELANKEVKTDDILSKAKATADTAFKKLEVTVEIKTSVAENALKSEQNEQAPSQNTSSKPISSEHTHSYKAATCTEPQKCSCGATKGKANGHSFKDGKCTVCGAKDPSATVSYTDIAKKKGSWSAEYIVNGTYYSAGLSFAEEISFGIGVGDPLDAMEPEIAEDIRKHKNEEGYKESYVVFQGKEYWSGRGCGAEFKISSESGNVITLTAIEDANVQIVLERTGENTLSVKAISNTFTDMMEQIPVGTKLTFKAE